MREDKKQKKGVSWKWIVAVAAVYFIFTAVMEKENFDFDNVSALFSIVSVAIAAAGFLLALKVAWSKKREQKSQRQAVPGRRQAWNGRIPHRRDRQIEDRPLPAPQRSFSPAVYDENLREDSSRQDRERRLRQLEDFYKNGIIEKEEYLLLKNRYSKS